MVEIRHYSSEMSPEFNLKVANFLYLFLHIIKKLFKFFNIGQLFVYVFHLLSFFDDVRLYYVLIAKDSKLLLDCGSFL